MVPLLLSGCAWLIIFSVLLQEQGPFSERQASLVLYDCLRVIAACHSLNVVHGDVKPANFLLKQRLRNPMPLIEAGSVTDWLKAIDFGCSQEVRGIRFSRRTGTPGGALLPHHVGNPDSVPGV